MRKIRVLYNIGTLEVYDDFEVDDNFKCNPTSLRNLVYDNALKNAYRSETKSSLNYFIKAWSVWEEEEKIKPKKLAALIAQDNILPNQGFDRKGIRFYKEIEEMCLN